MNGKFEGAAIRIERSGNVGELVLARPDRRNALDYQAVTEVVAGLRDLESDDQIGAVLLRGEGASFCAGGDLDEFRNGLAASPYELQRSGEVWADLMQVIPRMRKPVIAAVQGHALAGGCGLVAAADVVVAAEGTQFGTSEIRIGLFPIIVYPTLAGAIGSSHARQLAITGRRVDATEALRLGLVHQVVAADALLDVARRTAEDVASMGAHALALGKWFLHEVEDLPVERATSFAQAIRGAFMTTPDFAEGLAAFAERRPPQFRTVAPTPDTPHGS